MLKVCAGCNDMSLPVAGNVEHRHMQPIGDEELVACQPGVQGTSALPH